MGNKNIRSYKYWKIIKNENEMKNQKNNFLKVYFSALIALLAILSCERDFPDNPTEANFSKEAEVFTDTPVGMGSDFYFPYGGSKATAWSVDNEESYLGTASMRFDVPNADDPEGNYAGAIFRIDGAGRNLTDYDALTFWAKASQGVTIDEIGFGEDFFENKYMTTATNLSIGTNWTKYVIPIPDPSKLISERGMLRYAAGTQGTGGSGYTFWIDELKFEKLGTIAHPRPSIFQGEDVAGTSFIGVTIPITPLQQTFNMSNGNDQTVNAAPAYFEFTSSNPNVASVDASGNITVITSGTATINASLAGVEAEGSYLLNSLGDFDLAPTPTRNPNNVTSIFSDYYDDVPVDFYNGYWQPYQTTQSADFSVNGDNILNYTDFNFVGIQFSNPTVDATNKPNLHVNMFIPAEIPADLDFLVTIKDFGADQADGGGDDTIQQAFFYAPDFEASTWATLEIPLTLANKNNIGLIIFENINNPTTSSIENFYLDNIYFYGEPVEPNNPAPTPTTNAANVISMFSDAYTDVPVDTWNTGWSAATFEDISVSGNPTKKYTSLSFNGIETVGTPIDASTMTHLVMDVWTPNITEFRIKLVDFLGNGFGNGDTEAELTFNPAQGQWETLEIPLSNFSAGGMTAFSDINQLIISCNPAGAGTVFIDNVYFRN